MATTTTPQAPPHAAPEDAAELARLYLVYEGHMVKAGQLDEQLTAMEEQLKALQGEFDAADDLAQQARDAYEAKARTMDGSPTRPRILR